jgi:glycosyltransferase involved in cell wall biosynthesis
MNILFLVPYPVKESPSQRFRFEQYFEALTTAGHSFHVESFLNQRNWRDFSKRGNNIQKIKSLLSGLTRRVGALSTLHQYDVVFIHREAAPLGPPLFEWLIARVFKKRIIYDFDDALWLTDRHQESSALRIIKWRSKIAMICRWSYKVSCGNEFLCRYASKFNERVIYNPTTIDTEFVHNPALHKQGEAPELTIGWTGSNSTLKYLVPLEKVLTEITSRFPSVKFMVIADEKPPISLHNLVYKKWNIDTEIYDLQQFDIGVMPLPDDEWSRGKCAFKALQYMALQIPTVVSPVGVNATLIQHGINGFLASTEEEWSRYLLLLVENQTLRRELGKRGRETVVNQYSVRSNTSRFLSLFAPS